MTTTTKAIGYARVSTTGQADHGISLDAQRAKIEAWCALHDVQLVGIEVDAGISGKVMANRPALQRALDAIRTGRASTLVIVDLSRLTRRTRDLLDVVDRYFRTGERSLVSIRESIDTTTPAGRMIVTVLGAIGELEREQIGMRTSAAMAHMRSEGRYTGGCAPFGYALDGDQLVEVAHEQTVIVEARALRAAGMSLRAVACALAERGRVSRSGRPFVASAIAAMTDAV